MIQYGNSKKMAMLKFLSLLMVLLIVQCELTSALRILSVWPFAGKSHFIHGDILLRELARRGHQVDMVSHFPAKEPVANWRDISLKGTLPTSVNNMTFEQSKKLDSMLKGDLVDITGYQTCELLKSPQMEELLKTPKGTYDVIIVELSTFVCYIALGRHFDAPVVGFVASKLLDWQYKPFASPFNPSYQSSVFTGFTQRMSFTERLRNTFFFYFFEAQFDYHFAKQVPFVESVFNRKLSSIDELYDDVSLVLVNDHFSINDIKPSTPDIISVGGLHVDDKDQKLTPDLEKWLDESTAGCVYFTFGSMFKIETLPKEKLMVFYETFEKIAPVRVLMKVADEKALPPGLPKNVKHSPWLPQIAVLKHKNVKAFLTHGGLLGTQEALAHKVPMIGIPLFGDQHSNIYSYVNKKIALALDIETLSTDKLMGALDAVLNDPTYRNNIAEISELFMDRPMSALDTAVYWVEYTARHGTVLKSPATQLYWWQFYLLDVYGFLLSCIVMVLYAMKKFIYFLSSCFSSKSTKGYKTTSSVGIKESFTYYFLRAPQ